jgi:hypothetical protein
MKNITLITIIGILLYFNLQAQTSFVRKTIDVNSKSIITKNPDVINNIIKSNWVGQKIVFMPIYKKKQEYDYADFKGGKGFQDRPIYKECVGKIATILSLKEDSGEYTIKVTIDDDTSKTYIGHSRAGNISRICFLSDLEISQRELLGRTFWYKQNYINSRNDTTEKITILKDVRFKPLNIVGVYAGYDDNAPVELEVVLWNGKKAYVNLNISNNNSRYGMENKSILSDFFYFENPETIYPWDKQVWQDIKNNKISTGMTMEQVKFTWGEPIEIITESSTTSFYKFKSGNEVKFTNGLVDTK